MPEPAPGNPGPPQHGPEPDAGDPYAELREQLGTVPAAEVVSEAALPLITLAYVRLGIPEAEHGRFRDLDAARLLIDALGGLLEAVAGRLGPGEDELRGALAELRLAFVEAAEQQPQGDGPAGPPPAAPPRPSGLWVPGQG